MFSIVLSTNVLWFNEIIIETVGFVLAFGGSTTIAGVQQV